MAYEFFFSYTRGNSSPYLQTFFDDLSDELRDQLGRPKGEVVGFFDQRDIELGEEWQEAIIEALQVSKVMVCIYSPGYFKSPYCGKEWQFFQMRREAYRNQRVAAGENNPPLPPMIKPVFWLAPLPSNLNEAVKASQYLGGDPADQHNQEGLKYVLQKINDHRSFYTDYIKKLATQIREAAVAHQLPQLAARPLLKNVSSAFEQKEAAPPAAGAAPPAPAPARATGEPRHVRFVFVAADPQEFGNLRTADPYLNAGARDWKPFYPKVTSRIGRFVQNFVSSEELDFDSDELPLDDNLIQEIERAYDERKIVIILVDGWTVNWKQKYRDILEKFDREIKPYIINCSVLVPWNDSDLEVAGSRQDIERVVRDTFDIRANIWKNPIFYRDSIRSIEELREALREVLIQIRGEMHKRAERRKVAANNINKPVIHNQLSDGEKGL